MNILKAALAAVSVALVLMATEALTHVPEACELALAVTEIALNDASDKMHAVNDSAMLGRNLVQGGEAVPPLIYALHLQALGEFFTALGDLLGEMAKFTDCVDR
ncbi:MAG: hypothetical protein OXJ64_04120 [Boseongicola sp.]|nr:hypothetical protein [Boseongicola sp.]